jgi:hypothetical protein
LKFYSDSDEKYENIALGKVLDRVLIEWVRQRRSERMPLDWFDGHETS